MLEVLLLLGLGVVLGRLRALPDGAAGVLDQVVLRVSLPGLVLAVVPGLELGADTTVPVAVAWGALALVVTLILLANRIFRWDERTLGTLLLVVPLGNTSFIGIPAVEALLGADHVPYAVIYDQLGSFLALATWGTWVAARYGRGAPPDLRGVVRRVATFPPFVALAAALVVRYTGLPAPVEAVAETLGATLTPLAMLAVGLRLTVPHARTLAPLATGLTLKMLVAPAAVVAVAALVGDGGLAWTTSSLESAMPPMVTASVVAAASGLDDRLASNLVGAGVLAAAATLPTWTALLPG